MILPGAIFRLSQSKANAVFLTFDDGPHPDTTPKVAEILAKYDCHATFFVVGERLERYPALGKMLADAGHTVGNHSFTHKKTCFLSLSNFLRDVQTTQHLIETSIGKPCHYFRPPHGRILPGRIKRLNELRLKVVLWDVFVPDYQPDFTAAQIIRRVLRHTRAGSIILLHDTSSNAWETVQALPTILQSLRDRGFQLCALPGIDEMSCRRSSSGVEGD